MFRKIRIQLTVLNAIVFIIILSCFSTTLYFYMEYQLFRKVDASLLNISNSGFQFIQKGNLVKPEFSISKGIVSGSGAETVFSVSAPAFAMSKGMDTRMTILLWDKDNKLVNLLPALGADEKLTSAFQPTQTDKSPRLQKVAGQNFRVLAISKQQENSMVNSSDPGLRIATIEFIINVDPEVNMLQSLLMVLIAGAVIGGLAAIGAGFYLARRALVPISLSWEKQQQFVADASHELRTPLAVIQANTELLLRHPDHTVEEDSHFVSTVLKESKRMTRLVGGLLTLARTDSNQMEIYENILMLDQKLHEVVRQFEPLAEIKNISIKTDISENIEFFADEERLHQLFVILLDNAVKYTHEHGVITVSCRKSYHAITIIIEDTGVGIDAQDLPHIFERFYRGDKVRTRSEGGIGLGLSIAEWIVERHGGKIRAESRLAMGTKLIITFPVRPKS